MTESKIPTLDHIRDCTMCDLAGLVDLYTRWQPPAEEWTLVTIPSASGSGEDYISVPVRTADLVQARSRVLADVVQRLRDRIDQCRPTPEWSHGNHCINCDSEMKYYPGRPDLAMFCPVCL